MNTYGHDKAMSHRMDITAAVVTYMQLYKIKTAKFLHRWRTPSALNESLLLGYRCCKQRLILFEGVVIGTFPCSSRCPTTMDLWTLLINKTWFRVEHIRAHAGKVWGGKEVMVKIWSNLLLYLLDFQEKYILLIRRSMEFTFMSEMNINLSVYKLQNFEMERRHTYVHYKNLFFCF